MSEDEKVEQSDAVEEPTTEAPSPATGFQAKVTEFVENMINPSLAAHGGWVEVSSADEETGIIEMKMGGGCHGCGAACDHAAVSKQQWKTLKSPRWLVSPMRIHLYG